jgi:DNA-binding transcriptional MerR regulator
MSLRMGEVADAAGVNRETLRYYERRGLLAPSDRSPGGHRLYDDQAVMTLRVIKAAQRLGFTLEEVAELLEVGGHRHRNDESGLTAKAQAKLAEVDQRIADLQVMRETLQATIDAGCDDLVSCAEAGCCPLPFADLPSANDPTQAGARVRLELVER